MASNGPPGSGVSRSRPTSVVDTSASALSDYDWEQHGRDRHAASLAASNLAQTAAAADEAQRRARTLKRPKKGAARASAALAFPSTSPSDAQGISAEPSNRSTHSDHRSTVTRSPMPSLLKPHASTASPSTSSTVRWEEGSAKSKSSPQQYLSTSPSAGLKPPVNLGHPGTSSSPNGSSARELLSTLRARTISGSSSGGGGGGISGRTDDAASVHSQRSGPPSPSPMPAQLAKSAASAPLTGLSGPINMDARNASASTSPTTSVAGSFITRHEAAGVEGGLRKKNREASHESADATSSLRRLQGIKDWEGNSPGAIPKPKPSRLKLKEADAHGEAAVIIEEAEQEERRMRSGKERQVGETVPGAPLPGTPPGKVRGSRPGSSQEETEHDENLAAAASLGKDAGKKPVEEEMAHGPEPRRRKSKPGRALGSAVDPEQHPVPVVDGSISRAVHKDWQRIDRVLDAFDQGRHVSAASSDNQTLRYNLSLVLKGLGGVEARMLNFSIPVPAWVPGSGLARWAVDLGARGSAMLRNLLEST